MWPILSFFCFVPKRPRLRWDRRNCFLHDFVLHESIRDEMQAVNEGRVFSLTTTMSIGIEIDLGQERAVYLEEQRTVNQDNRHEHNGN